MPNNIFLLIVLLFATLLVNAQTYKSNTIRIGVNAIYFPDWQKGKDAIQPQERIEYQRNLNAHFSILGGLGIMGAVYHWFPTQSSEYNTPFVVYRAYLYYDLGASYTYYIHKKYYFKGAMAVSLRDRRFRVNETLSPVTGHSIDFFEGTDEMVFDKKIGCVPSVHFAYLPLKCLELSISGYYRYYLPNHNTKYFSSENRFLLGASIGFLFGKSREIKR